MKLATIVAALLLACVALTRVLPRVPSGAERQTAKPPEPAIWIVSGLSNVHEDSEQEEGHGVGDSLTVIVRRETAVGGLSELEGSQQDPEPVCLTGSFRNSFLHLESHPEDVTYETEQVTIRGKLYPIPHGPVFHGRIIGGPFHFDPNSQDPHFPAIVTLRVRDEHHEDDPSDWLESGPAPVSGRSM